MRTPCGEDPLEVSYYCRSVQNKVFALFAAAGKRCTPLGEEITGVDENGRSLQERALNSKGSRRSPFMPMRPH